MPEPKPWILPARTIAVRLFLTCWIVLSVHVATNTVREIYLALAIGDHLSFRVDASGSVREKGFRLAHRRQPRSFHTGAIPYFFTRPIVDRVVARVSHARVASGLKEPPGGYNSP